MSSDEKPVRDSAIGLLARREHSHKELTRKLSLKGYSPSLISTVIEQLISEGLQSDQRFTETYLHSRLLKGYGPVRLRQELCERGIDDNLIDICIDSLDIDWMDILHSVRQKKFGGKLPARFTEQAKESQFLQYRGFTAEQIRKLYRNDN